MEATARSKRRRRLLSGVMAAGAAVLVAYSCGTVVPPTSIQQLQTRAQERRYDEYPKPEGMDRIGVERYTLSHDTFGPRTGRVRYVYSIPDGWSGRELITWLRGAAPVGLVVVDDSTCVDLALSTRLAPPPTPTSAGGVAESSEDDGDRAMTLLDAETSVALLGPDGSFESGLTFRLRQRLKAPKPTSFNDPEIGISPDEDLVVVADHQSFACGNL